MSNFKNFDLLYNSIASYCVFVICEIFIAKIATEHEIHAFTKNLTLEIFRLNGIMDMLLLE